MKRVWHDANMFENVNQDCFGAECCPQEEAKERGQIC